MRTTLPALIVLLALAMTRLAALAAAGGTAQWAYDQARAQVALSYLAESMPVFK